MSSEEEVNYLYAINEDKTLTKVDSFDIFRNTLMMVIEYCVGQVVQAFIPDSQGAETGGWFSEVPSLNK